jgi:glycosyltransferase involved in cell wall biosynthesis
MRIAQVAPLSFSVPPKLYGGIERVVSYLTEELVQQGHEVTLFASGDSETSAKLVGVCPQALFQIENYEKRQSYYVRMMELVFEDVSRFDVIHFHTESLQVSWLRQHPCPSVTTLHGELGVGLKPLLDQCNLPLVSISDSQRRPIPKANWQATIYHGLPRDLYTFRKGRGDYLAFIGRASPEKRLDRAIHIARRAEMKLKVAVKINPKDQHFKQNIEPLLDKARDLVEFIGEVGGREKDEFLGNAYALLFPIGWAEPFGLVMIESLACGTPVIAWRSGAVPEVIDDGSTGFIVESVEEAAQAVGRIADLSRQTCRQVFEDRFDAACMTRKYVEVYRRLVNAGRE